MDKLFEMMEKQGIIPVVALSSIEKAVALADTLSRVEIGAMEITLRTETALDCIAAVKKAHPQMLVGAGTVLSVVDVADARQAGADFIVTPGFRDEVVSCCQQQGLPVLPGCVTPSELDKAVQAGLKVVKYFPASANGGRKGIDLVAGPYRSLRFVPTGGIDLNNLADYLSSKAVLCCGGSYMAKAAWIDAGDFAQVEKSCRKALAIAQSARQPAPAPDPEAVPLPEQKANVTVGLGDLLLSFSPMGYQRFFQAGAMELSYTGAEANVLCSLGRFGMKTRLLTRVPGNDLGDCAMTAMLRFGVDCSYVARGGQRIGTLYLEKGASQRPSKVIYDRMNSGMCEAVAEDFDLEKAFEGATWFHFTGITPALSDRCAALCKAACQMARKKGVTISCDLNYRKNLWTQEKARQVMEELLPYVDVLIANEEDVEKVLGIRAGDSNVEKGALDQAGYVAVADLVSKRFGIKVMATTLRESRTASDNGWSALLYTNGNAYFSRKYDIHIVNRVGGGDSFSAGLIYALQQRWGAQKAVEFAAAASCLKHTIESDVNLSTVADVEQLLSSGGSGRVQR